MDSPVLGGMIEQVFKVAEVTRFLEQAKQCQEIRLLPHSLIRRFLSFRLAMIRYGGFGRNPKIPLRTSFLSGTLLEAFWQD